MYIEESGLSQGGIYRFYNDLDEIWKNTSLWKEIIQIDLTEQLRNAKIPYMILQGDTDIVASTKLVKELVADSNNTNLVCNVVTNTGHMPGVEMMGALLAVLKNVVCNYNFEFEKEGYYGIVKNSVKIVKI